MPYYTTSTTFIGAGKPVTLGIQTNFTGSVSVTMDFSGDGSGTGATETYTENGIYVIDPGYAKITVTASGGAAFELV